MLFLWNPTLWTFAFLVIGAYRIFATLRISEGRVYEVYLRTSSFRSELVFICLQLLILLVRDIWDMYLFDAKRLWFGLSATLLLGSVLLFASTLRRYSRTKWPARVKQYKDEELPSITVAVPARNETEDLRACLESIVASNYPKLEILVYDDCSQERRTPEIIRGFAHDGVRFIQVADPIDSWLPKNIAYDRLYKEANGEYIVFCGVDTRFGPDSLTRLISLMKGAKKGMVSVLPRRDPSVYGRFALVQAMRYWWELAPPRRLFHRPAVMSSCWAVRRDSLKRSGAFAAVSRSVVPEAFFARKLSGMDSYSFRRADENLGIVSAKAATEQRDTAIRIRYPQMHKRPEVVLVFSALELGLLVLPYALLISGWIFHMPLPAYALLALTCVLLSIGYMVVARSTLINTWLFSAIGLPIVVLTDIGLLHYSMWKYEFSTVEWKGRNICVPAMHVIPHLPKLPD